MSRIPLVAGNWKMNRSAADAVNLVEAMLPALLDASRIERLLCPPYVALPAVAARLAGTPILLGAQHMHWEDAGAFTGEISPPMLKDLCRYVIVGHSERRAYFGETDETVNRRVRAGLRHGLALIVCVGETLAENEAGQAAPVVSRQVRAGLQGLGAQDAASLVVAYEPVWAIGSGRAATPADAERLIAGAIRPALAESLGAEAAAAMRVLYGGSVTAANAAAFFASPEIDGALVGGASLKPEEFGPIVAAAGG